MSKSNQKIANGQLQEVLRGLAMGIRLVDPDPNSTGHSTTQPDHRRQLEQHLWQGGTLNAEPVSAVRAALRMLTIVTATKSDSRPGESVPIARENGLPTRQQLLTRYLKAEASGDKIEQQLVELITSYRLYRLSETALPLQMLYMLTLMYLTEQLELAAQFLHAAWRGSVEEDPEGSWDLVAMVSAYRYRIGREAWRQFTQQIGIDPDYLIQGNYRGSMLQLCDENLCNLAPTAEQVSVACETAGYPVGQLPTVEGLANSWRKILDQVCGA